MFHGLCVITVDNKDEGSFLETTSYWKFITANSTDRTLLKISDSAPPSVHKALVGTMNSSDAHPLLHAVANCTPAQLEVLGPGSTISQPSGFAPFLSGPYSGTKT